MKTLRGFFGGLLLGVAVAGAAPAQGQEGPAKIVGVIHEVNPEAGVLVVREAMKGTVVQRSIDFGPQTRVLQSGRDTAHRIVDRPAAPDQLRRGDYVVVTTTRDGGRLRAVEVRVTRGAEG